MFDDYILRLKSLGWRLVLEHEFGCLFQKRNWNCDLDGSLNTITFHYFNEVRFYEEMNKTYRPLTEGELHDYHERFDENNLPPR